MTDFEKYLKNHQQKQKSQKITYISIIFLIVMGLIISNINL